MKAYLIADITVKDPVMYRSYIVTARPLVLKHGGRYLVRGGNAVPMGGDWTPERLLVIEFDSMEKLKACFYSEDYLRVAPLRENSTVSRCVIVEGLPDY